MRPRSDENPTPNDEPTRSASGDLSRGHPRAGEGAGEDEDLWCPEQLGPYEITRLIGYGGMGLVYEARHKDGGPAVALKVVRQGSVDPRSVRRFERESAVLARLNHPGIAKLVDSGVYRDITGPIPYYVIELIESAQSITAAANRRTLDDKGRCELFRQVCSAVQHAHDAGIVHRDLKPSNILVGGDGVPKIIDFGVARATRTSLDLSSMHTASGAIIGTLQYMAPEQVDAERGAVGPSADIYSLGAILYELLCGRLPLHFGDRPYHQAAWMLCTHAHADPRKVRPGLDDALARVLDIALAKTPEDRYASANDLAGDLERWGRGLPIRGQRGSSLRREPRGSRSSESLLGRIRRRGHFDEDTRVDEGVPRGGESDPPSSGSTGSGLGLTSGATTQHTGMGSFELGWPELLRAGDVLLDRLEQHGLVTGLARLSLSARLEPAQQRLAAGGPEVLAQDRPVAVEVARVLNEMGGRAGRYSVRIVRAPGDDALIRVRVMAFHEAQRWLLDAGRVTAWSNDLQPLDAECTLAGDDPLWTEWHRQGATHLSVSIGQREGRSLGERNLVVPLAVARWDSTEITFEVDSARVELVSRCRSGSLRSLARERS